MEMFLAIAHRGASGREPENTLRAIRRGLELGANGVEIDVRLSADGELVVIHDAQLRRTTGSPGLVSRRTLAQLQALDAGEGEPIPTLRQVLDLIAGRAWLNVELKARGTGRAVSAEITRAIESGGGWSFDRLVVSSFDQRELATVTDPRIRVGVLLARRPLSIRKLTARLRASSVHLPARLATGRMVERIHNAGALALVYTVNDPKEMERLRALGVDGVFTDFPERAGRLMKQAATNR